MCTIITFIVTVQILISAAGVPASPLPSSLYNTRHKLDDQPDTDIRDGETASSHSQEDGNGSVQANVSESEFPIEGDQDYSKCVPQPEGFGPRPV